MSVAFCDLGLIGRKRSLIELSNMMTELGIISNRFLRKMTDGCGLL